MNKKNSKWTIVFWLVTGLAILQYIFIMVPRIQDNPDADGAYILGSIIPNAIIIFIFWMIKRKAEK